MKKSLKIICVAVLILALVVPIAYTKAVANTNLNKATDEKTFFKISKLEIAKKDKIEMTLNIDNVKFDEFVFELKSDEVLKDVEISQSGKIETEKSNHEISMEINKEKTNIKNINFYYSIPDNKKVGDTIKFTATVTSVAKNKQETDNTENKKENDILTEKELVGSVSKDNTDKKDDNKLKLEDEKNVNTNAEQKNEQKTDVNAEQKKEEKTNASIEQIALQKPETISIEFEVKIIDDKKEQNNQNTQTPNMGNINESDKQNVQTPNMGNINESDKQNFQVSNTGNNKQTISNGQGNIPSTINKGTASNIQYSGASSTSFSGSEAVKKVTYNGSDNNYLSELSVDGYELNKEYSKDNTTYFITVEKEIASLNVKASAEDSGAKVCVYGNENLKEGTNKILISVTAENGNVRNYRIYVTKKA